MRPAMLLLGQAIMALAFPIFERAGCVSGLYIIVARGTLETGEGRAAPVSALLKQRVPGSVSVAVDYPATFTNPAYEASVSAGVADVKAKIQAYISGCGAKSRIVLVGFSQGGNVMTDALAGGTGKPPPINADLKAAVKAVAVFGDPTFTAGKSYDVGTSTTDGLWARREGPGHAAGLNAYANILRSYCDAEDSFCASGKNSSVHFGTVTKYAQEAVDFVVGVAARAV